MTIFLSALGALQVSSEPNQFNGFLLLGYAVMWLIFMLYILSIYLRQRNVQRDLELLEQILQDDDEYSA